MRQVELSEFQKLSEHLASLSEAALGHLSELNGSRLSPHFTLGEMTKTSYHPLGGNIPSGVHIYRSEELNRMCGGATGSNHLTGCAADIRCLGPEQQIRYATILLDVADQSGEDFDELILERRGTTRWVHFAVRPKDNRRKTSFIMA